MTSDRFFSQMSVTLKVTWRARVVILAAGCWIAAGWQRRESRTAGRLMEMARKLIYTSQKWRGLIHDFRDVDADAGL